MIGTWLTKINNWRYEAREDRRAWSSTRTVPEVGRKTARWLSGELGYHPNGYDVPDPETEELTPTLIAANMAGFATYNSQPGGRWEEESGVWRQRAFVDGWLEPELFPDFCGAFCAQGLFVANGGADIDLTTCNGEATTGGAGLRRRDYGLCLPRGAARAAKKAFFVLVVDEVWERNDLLWQILDDWAATQ
jgi:hypothetical protein